MDAKVLEQCAEAAKDGQDPDAIVERVSHYIQREYMSDKEWTNNIVTSLVAAYAAYVGKTPPSIQTKRTEDHSERQRKRQSEKQSKRQIEQDKATSVSADTDSYIIQPMGIGFQIVEKYDVESRRLAERAVIQKKNYSPWRLVGCSTIEFIKYYIFGRFFLLGWWGFIHCVNLSYFRFLKFAKYYEIHNNPSAEGGTSLS